MVRASFSALLLAGGKSTRMGRDKALLNAPDSNLLLWQRQLAVLEDLQPQEIFWSGPARPGVPECLHFVTDQIPNAGPLAGISAGLDLLQTDLLVVLAIDLPWMTASFLHDLLHRCSPKQGAVIRRGDFFEPLAAVYPKGIQPLAVDSLNHGRYALQSLLLEAVEKSLMQAVPLDEKDAFVFQNWNTPGFRQ